MTSCSDDAAMVGPVSLFLGVETASWSIQQFIDAAQFSKQHGVTSLFIKVFEVGSAAGDSQGLWFGSIGGYDKVVQAIKSVGVQCIVYGFLYGDTYGNLSTEIATSVQLLKQYGTLCLDWEGQYLSNTNSASWATQIAQALSPLPGKLWLSCPANPVENNQLAALQAISPAVNIWMPMIYNDYLASVYQSEFQKVNAQACIQPTIDLSQEFGQNTINTIVYNQLSNGILAISCWEYQFALANTQLLDNIVNLMNGKETSAVQLNKQGMVLDIQQSYQLENGESQDLCGPWSVSALRLAGLPGQGPRGTAEDIDVWADTEANKYMPNGQVGWPGSSIQDMYNFLTDSLDPVGKQRNLHWWDIAPTIANIQAAVRAGYPVLITVNEQNIRDKRTGAQPPYPWRLNANHIIPVCGLDADGDFICPDELNNNFQGYWPPVYVASILQPSWATIVQVVGPDPTNPWLAAIPSGDPGTWPQGFNAQLFAQKGAVQSVTQELLQMLWNSTKDSPPFNGTPPSYGSGIAKKWLADGLAGNVHGAPTAGEFSLPSVPGVVFQPFQNGYFTWSNNEGTWTVYK